MNTPSTLHWSQTAKCHISIICLFGGEFGVFCGVRFHTYWIHFWSWGLIMWMAELAQWGGATYMLSIPANFNIQSPISILVSRASPYPPCDCYYAIAGQVLVVGQRVVNTVVLNHRVGLRCASRPTSTCHCGPSSPPPFPSLPPSPNTINQQVVQFLPVSLQWLP